MATVFHFLNVRDGSNLCNNKRDGNASSVIRQITCKDCKRIIAANSKGE